MCDREGESSPQELGTMYLNLVYPYLIFSTLIIVQELNSEHRIVLASTVQFLQNYFIGV